MKIDLTVREIELILALMGDAASSEFLQDMPIYSLEEKTLVEKLEASLKRGEILEKALLETGETNTLQH